MNAPVKNNYSSTQLGIPLVGHTMDEFGVRYAYYDQESYFPQPPHASHAIHQQAKYDGQVVESMTPYNPGIENNALQMSFPQVHVNGSRALNSVPSNGYDPHYVSSNNSTSFDHLHGVASNGYPKKDEDYFEISVPGLSLTPMKTEDVIDVVRVRCNEVLTRYLPCVDFLVSCQQELRAGLAHATKKKLINHSYRGPTMTPRQFYNRYLDPLPTRFASKNRMNMAPEDLSKATNEIMQLCYEAKKNEQIGCESIKNTFLGGMRDGESWGLRRWLSKNGGGLKICNDTEVIFQAIQKLDREAEITGRIAALIRPIACNSNKRLKKDIPAAYQEVSSAHPYLPFFHRMESALNSLSNFDPEDDDVIIIDDEDEIEEVKSKGSKKKNVTKSNSAVEYHVAKKPKREDSNPTEKSSDFSSYEENEDLTKFMESALGSDLGSDSFWNEKKTEHVSDNQNDSDCEVVCVMVKNPSDRTGEPGATNCAAATSSASSSNLTQSQKISTESQSWRCTQCTFLNRGEVERCAMCELDDDFDGGCAQGSKLIEPSLLVGNFKESTLSSDTQNLGSKPHASSLTAVDGIISYLDSFANMVERDMVNIPRPARHYGDDWFWNENANFAFVLRLFASVLKEPSANWLLEPVDEKELCSLGYPEYRSVIIHPLSFRNIVNTLIKNDKCSTKKRKSDAGKDGILEGTSLGWNMWFGRDLLQAIDLVILNCLAYYGQDKGRIRTEANRLRNMLWKGINNWVGRDRMHMPTKHGESSGFVVVKKRKP